MRIVFAGTPHVAVPSLEQLIAAGHEVVGVITRPDAPQGRERTPQPSPVKAAARSHGLTVIETTAPGAPQEMERLRALRPEAAAIVAYGAILPARVLQVPEHGWVNLHFSVLPAWRGAAPVQHALIAGDEIAGATTFLVDEGMDTGPVLGTLTIPLAPGATAGTVVEQLSREGAPLLEQSLVGLVQGSITPVAQSGDGVSYAPKISVADAALSWENPALAVERLVRGTNPSPGAWTIWRGSRLKVHEARRVQTTDPDVVTAAARGDLIPGRVWVAGGRVLVATGHGVVELLRVQPAGKSPVTAADWARGARFTDEEVLGG